MNILFITLADIRNIDSKDIYCDLIREFARNNHNVYIVSPAERRSGEKTRFLIESHSDCMKGIYILKIRTGNIQKTNFVEKGFSTLLLEVHFKLGIKKYLRNVQFDLVLYSTPPVTIVNPIKYVKQRDGALTYLMLKDITPQAIVDLGAMKTNGIIGFIYQYLRKKERKLYQVSDYIGCMSQANVDYLLEHNSEIDPNVVEICPNSIELVDMSIDEKLRRKIRRKYGIPEDKTVYVYGGNLGKPQGIDFLINCLSSQRDNKETFFLIVGDGTEYRKIENFIKYEKPSNVKLMSRIPQNDYDTLVAACDVGMIFLDYRFTVPNFPSRLLSYLQAKIPVLACTDSNTDIGKVITQGGFGWWCESNNVSGFGRCIKMVERADLCKMGEQAYKYLELNFNVTDVYKRIIDKKLNNSKKTE